jgi:two-component system cell cycle sensor histidine kinase PleC
VLRRDGTEMLVETQAAMVIWDGKPASLSWISDISRRKAMEAQLLRSKEAADSANRAKTEFLAKMSHELRTPLNAILGFSEMMQTAMRGPLNAKYLEYAGDIHASGEHLLGLVNDILDLAKLEAGKVELQESDVTLPELTEECLALVRGQADRGNVRLAAVVPHTLPALRADRRSLKQLLLNLLSNALKFTPDGGTVTVLANGGERFGITLSVRDTGIGMSAAEIEVALSPFGQIESAFRRTQKGTGLGLPICKSLVELHDGTLHVSSEPGGGTTLSATFPSYRTVVRPLTCAV